MVLFTSRTHPVDVVWSVPRAPSVIEESFMTYLRTKGQRHCVTILPLAMGQNVLESVQFTETFRGPVLYLDPGPESEWTEG